MTPQLTLFPPKPPTRWRCAACEWFSGTKCHEALPWVERDPRATACERVVVRAILLEALEER